MKRAIEEYFPIVDINRLAVPERNAFKPIYTMHKWFARRSSSVFRAILLGALKPAGTDIMKEFYKDHTNDPDTKGKVILDPFMGGGTTVVEALRLGCKVIGVDLNPVAWFIVKTEVEPVDLLELRAAFDRLANRTVEWSGKPLKETLLSLYKTECPECGNKDADIIYTFWVKSAPCTTGTCKHYTPLFSDYIISQKKPSIRYYPDCECPKCKNKFDWEVDSASLVGNVKLMVDSPMFSAGEGRTNMRWAYATGNAVECPWCNEDVTPKLKSTKTKRKKIPLSVLYCPHCEEVWQYRGEVGESVECPSCKHGYNANEGNLPDKGKFICRGTCGGNVDAVIAAIRTLPQERLLPLKPYSLEGFCSKCAGTINAGLSKDLFDSSDGEKEISSDEMHKNTRGIIEPAELKEKGLVIKGRENRGRSFEVKQPVERMNELKPLFNEVVEHQPNLFAESPNDVLPKGLIFVDMIHLLIGLAELGENLSPWLEKFSGRRPQIRAALDYLISHPKVGFRDSAKKVLNLMDERTLFTK